MSEDAEAVRRKIDGARDMRSVVGTMKALAMVNVRHYVDAVEAARDSVDTVEMALAAVLEGMEPNEIRVPPSAEGRGVVAIGSAHGMCGAFNEKLAAHVAAGERGAQPRLLAMGDRIIPALDEAGVPADSTVRISDALGDLSSLMLELLDVLEQWREGAEVGTVAIYHNAPASGVGFRPRTVELLPPDGAVLLRLAARGWPERVRPLHTLERSVLMKSLLRHHLFASLQRMFVESLAAENSARLSAMQAAEQNIDDRLEELVTDYHQHRQQAITAELLDIVGGFEALRGMDGGGAF